MIEHEGGPGYRCASCGFDTDWAHDPIRADTVALFRELTCARDALQLGCDTLRDPLQERGEQLVRADRHELAAHAHLARVHAIDPALLDDLFGENFATQLRRVEEARRVVRRMLSSETAPPSNPTPASPH